VANEGTTCLAREINFGPGAISVGIISRLNGPAYPFYLVRICLSLRLGNVKYNIVYLD
jgi:hypothetical protein